jgi:hypothetical protein
LSYRWGAVWLFRRIACIRSTLLVLVVQSLSFILSKRPVRAVMACWQFHQASVFWSYLSLVCNRWMIVCSKACTVWASPITVRPSFRRLLREQSGLRLLQSI